MTRRLPHRRAGLVAAAVLSRSLLSGLAPLDPVAFGTTAMLTVTACVASLIPVRRAARVDPMVALRAE